MPPRVAYLDLDGTLTHEGSMLHGAHGVTLAGARALAALHEASVRIVPASGRTVVQTREVARLLGSRDCLAELGAVIVRDGREERTYDAREWPGARSPEMRDLAARLCDEAGAEPYEPWFSLREHTLLLRGPAGIRDALAARADELRAGVAVIDNGEVERGLHAYHVLPSEVSKARAIERDLAARKLTATDAVAFGDSDGDREMARAVGTFYHLGGASGGNVVGVPERFAEGLERAVALALSG